MRLSMQEFCRAFTLRFGDRAGIHSWVRCVPYEFNRPEELSKKLLIVQQICLQFMQLSREFDVVELKDIVLLTSMFKQRRGSKSETCSQVHLYSETELRTTHPMHKVRTRESQESEMSDPWIS